MKHALDQGKLLGKVGVRLELLLHLGLGQLRRAEAALVEDLAQTFGGADVAALVHFGKLNRTSLYHNTSPNYFSVFVHIQCTVPFATPVDTSLSGTGGSTGM